MTNAHSSPDIVERLRGIQTTCPTLHGIFKDAADEIEHLRLEHQHACQEIGVAIAERDQARSSAGIDTPRGNYEQDRHPNDMVLHPLTEIREWDEALAVLGIQDSDQTPAEAIRELNAEIERLRHDAQPSGTPAVERLQATYNDLLALQDQTDTVPLTTALDAVGLALSITSPQSEAGK